MTSRLKHVKIVEGVTAVNNRMDASQCIKQEWATEGDGMEEDICSAVRAIVPERHEEVMRLVCRILLQEEHTK